MSEENLYIRLRKKKVHHGSNVWIVLGFLLPALLLLIFFRIVPLFSAIWGSLFTTNILDSSSEFNGILNYLSLLKSPSFLNSVKVTLIFSLIINPFQIIIALILSVILIQPIFGSKFLRTVIFLPVAIPPAVSALVGGLALRPDGVINSFLSFFGIPPQPFLTSPNQALFCIIIILSWIGIGYWTVFLVAGLKEIPVNCMEAAIIDGASWFTMFIRVILPMMRRTLAFVLISNTVINFIIFVHVQVLTKGGPAQSTNLIVYQIYRQVYKYGNENMGATQITILMIIVLSIVLVQYRIISRER